MENRNLMSKNEMNTIISAANKKQPVDLLLKNCKIIDVYQGKIMEGNIGISGNYIIGIGNYQGKIEIDLDGSYVSPGFIDAHMHLESIYVSPSEAGRLLVPRGTTTIIADPHEIVNVCGTKGLDYMLACTNNTALDIKYMLPSCVPCTPFETSGAIFLACDMDNYLNHDDVLGLGEFMNHVGVNNCNDDDLSKIYAARMAGKIIDGHAPGVVGTKLDGYVASGVRTDHECSSVEEVNQRISRGMYVEFRQGSACRDLKKLLPAVTKENLRYCLLCSDDREPETIFKLGHMDDCLRICVEEGLDPISAIRMATINTAECYRLYDRGGIAPGLLANIVILKDLTDFTVQKVMIKGEFVAENGTYLKPIKTADISSVSNSMKIKDFSIDKLKLPFKSNHVIGMEVSTDGVLTKKVQLEVKRNENDEFVYDKNSDINKIAVIERHTYTGNVGVGLIKGFGIKTGAIAQTIAHDSHNVMVVGMSDEDMALAVTTLIEMGGGIVVVNEGVVLSQLELPIAGLMSDKTGEEVRDKFKELHEICHDKLGITEKEPIVQLSFMSLPVIPEIKITDKGLFDVTEFSFISQ